MMQGVGRRPAGANSCDAWGSPTVDEGERHGLPTQASGEGTGRVRGKAGLYRGCICMAGGIGKSAWLACHLHDLRDLRVTCV